MKSESSNSARKLGEVNLVWGFKCPVSGVAFQVCTVYFGVSHTIFWENLRIPTQNHLLFHSYYL